MDTTSKIEKDILDAICPIKIEGQRITDLCRALIKGEEWVKIVSIIKGIDSEPEKVRRAVLEYCCSVLLSGHNSRAAKIIRCFKDPFDDSGKAGLLLACYEITSN